MSERDSVHTEIEKLQEKVEAREARIAQLERKAKEQEGEVRESTLVISSQTCQRWIVQPISISSTAPKDAVSSRSLAAGPREGGG